MKNEEMGEKVSAYERDGETDFTGAYAAPAVAEMRTVEDWATAKGLLPERIMPGEQTIRLEPIANDHLSASAHAVGAQHDVFHANASGAIGVRINPDSWMFTAAKLRCGWPIGKMVTESEFDTAVAKHTEVICR